MMKATWVFSIVKALEARKEFLEEESYGDELEPTNEALAYFKSLRFEDAKQEIR